MVDKFEQLLKDLSLQLNTELHVDQNEACLISFDDKLQLQLELDQNSENLIVYCSIGTIPPGKFKENVFTNALKENNKFPYVAIFSFCEKENNLAMFNLLPFASLKAEFLASYLTTFADLAALYQNAILHGQSSPILKPNQ